MCKKNKTIFHYVRVFSFSYTIFLMSSRKVSVNDNMTKEKEKSVNAQYSTSESVRMEFIYDQIGVLVDLNRVDY